jgi:hypothetical protein
MSQQWLPQPQPGQWQPQPPPPGYRQPPPRRRQRASLITGIAVCAAAAIIIIFAAAKPPPAENAAPTVTFVTSGSPADVTWGDAGSSAQGTVPMRETIPLGSPLYYSVNVQLQGDGQASCQILVGTVVVSAETATGGYSIATCEISKDPVTGQWASTTGG